MQFRLRREHFVLYCDGALCQLREPSHHIDARLSRSLKEEHITILFAELLRRLKLYAAFLWLILDQVQLVTEDQEWQLIRKIRLALLQKMILPIR